MRVLLVGDYPPPSGGIAVHVRQLHDHLVRRGVPVAGVDLGRGGVRQPGVTAVRSAPALALALATPEAAVTHLHTSGNNPRSWGVVAAVGVLRSARRGPALVTLHSGLLPAWIASARGNGAMVRAALAPYAGIVAVSDAVAAALHGAGIHASRLWVQPAFLGSQVLPGSPPPGFERIRARRRPLLALAHHPSPVYGREIFLAALGLLAPRHPGIGAAIFGPGTGDPAFSSAVQSAGVGPLVEVLGELGHAQALAVLQRSDVFVRPTTADGDAISVREALALGVPCVASDVARRPEGVLTHAGGDAAGLARAVEEALGRERRPARGPDAGPFLIQRYQEAWDARPGSNPNVGG